MILGCINASITVEHNKMRKNALKQKSLCWWIRLQTKEFWLILNNKIK